MTLHPTFDILWGVKNMLNKLENIEVENVNTRDYPDFCDAYISYAEVDGRLLNEHELNEVNECSDFVYECAMAKLY